MVLPENWAALCLYRDCATQLKRHYVTTPSSVDIVFQGFNYVAVKVVMELSYAQENHTVLFKKLQIIEQIVLEILNKNSK